MYSPKIKDSDVEKQIKLMFTISMLVFILTISIGILNAVNAIEFNRAWILLHVHSGTLGWLSISAIAIMISVQNR